MVRLHEHFVTMQENFIPSQDHVRVVRILVKRLHFFVNSAQPGLHQSAYQQRAESAMEELKRYVPLYIFFIRCDPNKLIGISRALVS